MLASVEFFGRINKRIIGPVFADASVNRGKAVWGNVIFLSPFARQIIDEIRSKAENILVYCDTI